MTLNNTIAAARVCHEALRAAQAALGEKASPPWDDLPVAERNHVRDQVAHIVSGAGPRDLWKRWRDRRAALGWSRGDYDPTARTHPNMVDDYTDLPPDQRRKDALFHSIAHALFADTD